MSGTRNEPVSAVANGGAATPATVVLAWTPVVIWMAVIFSLSSDRFSDQNTAAWLSGIVSALGFPPAILKVGNWMLRKSAHFVEYAILGMLIFRALRTTWPWRRVQHLLIAAIAATALCASVDELHQYVGTATREGKAKDVVLDTVGAVAGAAAGGAVLYRRARRRPA
jgi:VanZ family protein